MHHPRSLLTATLGLLIAVTATACGGGEAAPVARGDCPSEPVPVVVTVDQWADIVERLGGDCVAVTTVISGAGADPHDFEPSPGDLARFGDARLVVLNGVDYDHWAEDAIESLDEEPAAVDAGEVAGAEDGDDPHLWYDPDLVRRVGRAVTAELRELAPDAKAYLDDRHADWEASMRRYDAALEELSAVAPGRTYAATEPVFDRMAAALGLTDATPPGYRTAALNESDPSPAAVAAFERALDDGEVDVLVFNRQTEGPVPDQLRRAAKDAGVPVVEVTESLPDGADSFAGWQVDQLRALQAALGR